MKATKKTKILALGLAALSCVATADLLAQSVATDPVGYVTVSIAAGTGTTRTLTAVSVPMLMAPAASGAMSGRITGVTANSINNSDAGWTAGQLSVAATPHVVRIKTGAAAGRSFLISTSTSNTESSLTIDASEGVDLTSLSITTGASGDLYEIVAVDTLSTLFPPSSGVLGGASASVADNVLINEGGVWRTYFYSTSLSRWTQVALGNPNASNKVIKADTAMIYSRLANTALTFNAVGGVPSIERKVAVANSGLTFIASGWPVDVTLANSGIQSLPGWTANSVAANADKVLLLSGGVYKTYYFDGTNWRQVALGNPIRNTDVIGATSGMLISQLGTATGSSVLSQSRPYSL